MERNFQIFAKNEQLLSYLMSKSRCSFIKKANSNLRSVKVL
jgi:hypothetical protein